jgi:two-component system response regulator YesN
MYKVLIVDDEPWVAYSIAHLIDWEVLGFRVIGEAFDGDTALEMIAEHEPHLVVSDIRMPGLDGIQLLEKIKEQQWHVEVILVSGYSEFEYAQQAIRLGAFDYLLKQVEEDRLLETVQRLTEKLQSKKQSQQQIDLFLTDFFELLEPNSSSTIQDFAHNKGTALRYSNFRMVSCQYTNPSSLPLLKLVDQFTTLHALYVRTGLTQWAILINYEEEDSSEDLLNYLSALMNVCRN